MSAPRRIAVPALLLAVLDGAVKYNAVRVALRQLDVDPVALQYVSLGVGAASFVAGTLLAAAAGYRAVVLGARDPGEPPFARQVSGFVLVALGVAFAGYLAVVLATLAFVLPQGTPAVSWVVLPARTAFDAGGFAVAALAGAALAGLQVDGPVPAAEQGP